MRGFKVGPVQNDEAALEGALHAAGLTSVEEAAAANLPDDEFDRLAARIEAYQSDYAETLARCEALDGAEGDSA